MVQRHSLLVASSALLLAGVVIGLWYVLGERASAPSGIPVQEVTPEATRGFEEDPDAWRTYALRRLRNPTTGKIPPNARRRELKFARTLPEQLRKSTSWQRRGPSNVGGRTRALAYDISDSTGETILAGGVSGGMWRTTDGGTTWTRTFGPAQHPSVTGLAQDPRPGRRDVWYVVSGERLGNSAYEGGAWYWRRGL